MGLFSWFMPKQKDKRTNHDFNDEEREMSAQTNKFKAQIKRLEMQKAHEIEMLRLEKERLELQFDLDDLKGIEEEEDIEQPNSFEEMMMGVLAKSINKTNSLQKEAVSSVETNSFSPPTRRRLTDEQLLQIWKTTPNKETIKKLNSEQIREYLRNNSDYDDVTIETALMVIKTN